MRNRSGAVLLAAALAACGGAAAGCGASSGSASMFAALPQVSGEAGSKPQVRMPPTEPGKNPQVRVLDAGEGTPVRPGQVVVTNVDIRVWRDGRTYLDTWRTRQPTTAMLDGKHVSRTWDRALSGRKPGARVLLVSPATEGFGPRGMAPAKVSPSDTLVEVFDVIGGYDPAAQVTGTQRPAGGGLPEVAVPRGAEPQITLPDGGPPAEPANRTLVEGTGPVVRPGSTIVANYVGMTWRGGQVFDSSYRRGGPNGFVVTDKNVPPGWARALTGLRGGSRVLMVVPEKLKRGFTMTPGGVGAPPGEAVVYVLDLLDVR